MSRGARFLSLADAVAEHVRDGDEVALEGFTHLIPFAAGHEIVRQGRRDLALVRMTPDVIYDQLIGMGCARRLTFSYGGNPGVGSLHRFRDAVEHGWPRDLEVVEHSHAGLAAAYAAGAARASRSASCAATREPTCWPRTGSVAPVTSPFTGERVSAVRAINPDVAVIHAQHADRRGNVMLWGLAGVQKEAVLAAKRAIVTVEEVVEALEPRPHSVVLPAWVLEAVVVQPGGAWPSYAAGYSVRDNAFYADWDEISRDRDASPSGCASTSWRRDERPPEEVMTVHGRARASRRPGRARRRRAAERGREPRPSPASTRLRARLRVRGDRRQARQPAAVDRRRRPRGNGRRARLGSGDVQLLDRRRPHRRRLPRAAQIDRRGNINTTVIGSYDHPKVRLPGAGGAPEIAAAARKVIVMLRHSPRAFVERLDFVTRSGRGGDAFTGDHRPRRAASQETTASWS